MFPLFVLLHVANKKTNKMILLTGMKFVKRGNAQLKFRCML